MTETKETCPVCQAKCEENATLCSVCGFVDELGINRKSAVRENLEDCKKAVLGSVATQAYNTFTDARDGKVYRTIKIGKQVWMAENLNYDAPSSVCYDNDPKNGEKYGRLYNWETAMKVAPSGWHLPSKEEWQTLVDFAGGKKIAETKLKSKSNWNEDGNGTDDYAFSALPGGFGNPAGFFYNVGNYGDWWSSSEDKVGSIAAWIMRFGSEYASWYYSDKTFLFSVRCLQNNDE